MSGKYLDKEFNFDKAVKNPYAKELKQQITIKILNKNLSKQEYPIRHL